MWAEAKHAEWCQSKRRVNSFRKKPGAFEWLPPTSKWALQISPLKWAYFLAACLPLCMGLWESALHQNTHNEGGGVGGVCHKIYFDSNQKKKKQDCSIFYLLKIPVSCAAHQSLSMREDMEKITPLARTAVGDKRWSRCIDGG